MQSETYELDDAKAEANLRKHGVSFAEAATVLDRDDTIAEPDESHNVDEPRWFAIGVSNTARTLVVVFTIREERARIISARTATAAERRAYEEEIGQ